jgi:hypothetical protein
MKASKECFGIICEFGVTTLILDLKHNARLFYRKMCVLILNKNLLKNIATYIIYKLDDFVKEFLLYFFQKKKTTHTHKRIQNRRKLKRTKN